MQPVMKSHRTPHLALKVRLCSSLDTPSLQQSSSVYLRVTVTSSPTATANQPIIVLSSTGGGATAFLNCTPVGFSPTSYQWSHVADPLNHFSVGPSSFAPPAKFSAMGAQTSVFFTTVGIYQLSVTATDGSTVATATTWVNCWDYKPALNSDGTVGRYPGVLPPTSVRSLYPDPGPFNHPRLLFTANDWIELSGKTTSSTEVSTAVQWLTNNLAQVFDSASTQMNALALGFYAYGSQDVYDATYYTATLVPLYKASTAVLTDLLVGLNTATSFHAALTCACYLAWLALSPSLTAVGSLAARRSYLATLTAAAANFELKYYGATIIGNTTQRYNLALCYDMAYNWMTPTQQLVTRSFLYAIGYGIYNNCKGGLTYTAPYVLSGSNQNGGDFPALADGIVLAALAIEGEESTVPSSVQTMFTPYVAPATSAWPGASSASVSNLHRQGRHASEWTFTRWGFVLNMVEYFQLGQNIAVPGTLAFARRWENMFVTTNLYQTCLATLYNLCLREDGKGLDLFDHHDGAGIIPGPNGLSAAFIFKYMYPDDPLVDYFYQILKREIPTGSNSLCQAIFATDPFAPSMAFVASAKGLGNFKFDPLRSVAICRNGWLDTDLMLQFESRWDRDGHMHAEKNNFSLYALGRAWANPPGYHCTINDLQATVLVQIPSLSADSATQGYLGQSPSSATQTPTSAQFPPVRGKLLEVSEDPAKMWTLFSGDATLAYNYALISVGTGTNTIDTGIPNQSLVYPGLEGSLLDEDLSTYTTGNVIVGSTSYNPVLNAKRTVFTARGKYPYVLVIDDFTADGNLRNYRWTMPNCISFGGSGGRFVNAKGQSVYSSLAMQANPTPTDAVVWHSPIDDAASGTPRLLIRDVSTASNSSQPPIFLDDRPLNNPGGNLTYGYDNNQKVYSTVVSRRVMIQRNAVVSPAFNVLLYPHLSGTALPTTAWVNANTLQLTHPDGSIDQIFFQTLQPIPASGNAKTRTARILALQTALTIILGFSRRLALSPQGLPSLTLPTAPLMVPATNRNSAGVPTAYATFSVSARDALGNSLPYTTSAPSGTYFPVGIHKMVASAVDAYGQQISNSFFCVVTPPYPMPTLIASNNLGTTSLSATLSWPLWAGVTGYNIKRSTAKAGPFTTVGTVDQWATSFTDATMPAGTTYYVVTALLSSPALSINFEGKPCPPISTAPPTNATVTAGQAGGVLQYRTATSSSEYAICSTKGTFNSSQISGTYATAATSGDGTFIARCSSYTTLNTYASFGVAYTSIAGDVFCYIGFSPSITPQINFTSKPGTTSAGTTISLPSNQYTFPLWFKLVRTGSFFFGYYSNDGASWTFVGTVRLSGMPTSGKVSLVAGATGSIVARFDYTSFLP
eukprot:TRINITY_DN216_c0_g2_i1.p1 TRINITY_DN216_c0_g2~~TRINITY_DN216_c0_g2_i1.p1  ORF type:complete len:1367 (+),score=113.18 TRINITY_DN216_c0_g2_i1:657-4757(+)